VTRAAAILASLGDGALTARDVADDVGITLHQAASYLYYLKRVGKVVRTDRMVTMMVPAKGRQSEQPQRMRVWALP
jgi:predicted Rossmann fold nucleotide-binding protein DprA/Smf involved in DNA uptake